MLLLALCSDGVCLGSYVFLAPQETSPVQIPVLSRSSGRIAIPWTTISHFLLNKGRVLIFIILFFFILTRHAFFQESDEPKGD